MDILHKGIQFNITQLPDEYRDDSTLRNGVKVNYVLLGYNRWNREYVHTYTYYEPSYEAPENMIYLDHVAWLQYLLIQHLPAEHVAVVLHNLGE